jgi:hypothetical protein
MLGKFFGDRNIEHGTVANRPQPNGGPGAIPSANFDCTLSPEIPIGHIAPAMRINVIVDLYGGNLLPNPSLAIDLIYLRYLSSAVQENVSGLRFCGGLGILL